MSTNAVCVCERFFTIQAAADVFMQVLFSHCSRRHTVDTFGFGAPISVMGPPGRRVCCVSRFMTIHVCQRGGGFGTAHACGRAEPGGKRSKLYQEQLRWCCRHPRATHRNKKISTLQWVAQTTVPASERFFRSVTLRKVSWLRFSGN